MTSWTYLIRAGDRWYEGKYCFNVYHESLMWKRMQNWWIILDHHCYRPSYHHRVSSRTLYSFSWQYSGLTARWKYCKRERNPISLQSSGSGSPDIAAKTFFVVEVLLALWWRTASVRDASQSTNWLRKSSITTKYRQQKHILHNRTSVFGHVLVSINRTLMELSKDSHSLRNVAWEVSVYVSFCSVSKCLSAVSPKHTLLSVYL